MNDCSSDKKCRIAFYASVAANIFFVAFLLGRFIPHEGLLPFEHVGRVQGGMLPGPMPPVFGPHDLFKPDEVRADEARLRKNFEEMDTMRKAFAAKLQTGPVSKEEALKHFEEIDKVMEGIKKEAKERFADRISAMSDAERQRFSQKLMNRDRLPYDRQQPDPR
ncbi:MAG: hypothetical protein WC464_00440 [Bdellovibrionales bacterium]